MVSTVRPRFANVWSLALHLQLNGHRPQCSVGSVQAAAACQSPSCSAPVMRITLDCD